ncbi:sugar kinase [Streptomyces sp. NBC_01619]|uniref:sugar kinase n=2 Tax=unclassified Streptomyces TaxID=2593676 RepID=UPI002257D659|nr:MULTISPECIES: sugar kinase [unclassified Streptomyces]MCX4512940.1 sugar kinase [Streptomyces sp. NBC_01619]
MTGTAAVDGDVVDVVCLGESMVTFLPSRPGRLADVPSFARTIGGAESNVACALAAAGHAVKWVSRVGADGFGDHLIAAVAAYGVDTSGVRRDANRPTGIYFRTATDRATDAHEVLYYRAGSAASAMSPTNVPHEDLDGARVLHLSGITAALSPECLGLMRVLTARRAGRPLVSFDVNHRPGLWREDPAVLLDLARGADVVFVGEDEAEEAWGLRGAAAIRSALPEPAVLVVKQGARGAVAYTRPARTPCASEADEAGHPEDTVTHVPAPRVDVVAAVGAGDAFAAGFLSASLRGLPVEARLRHGHLTAAATLTVAGDLGTPPPTAYADRLAALDDERWGTLHLGPGWTAADQAMEEVRTS